MYFFVYLPHKKKLCQTIILFFKNMKKKFLSYLKAAETINRAYDVPSAYGYKKYAYFMVYDDDITAVLKSAPLYFELKKINPELKYVVVGGEGLLAIAFKVMRFSLKLRCAERALSTLKKETEAERLKRVAMALGVDEKDIIVADKGHNTTENLQAMSQIAKGEKTLVVSTQRLAMIFKQSAEFQCNKNPEIFGCVHFNYDLFVIHQSVEKTLRWYNFQKAGNGRVAFHLFASIVRRFEVYNGKFLTRPFEPSDEVKRADAHLRHRFVIKQRLNGLGHVRALFQYVPIILSIFFHPGEYLMDEENAINEARHELAISRK